MTRRANVTKVQIAKRDLGMDDSTYRALLERLTGETSSTACSDQQLGVVLDELKAKGWKPKVVQGGKIRGRSGRTLASSPVAKKARALWISLYQLGVVDEPAESALEAFGCRQLGVERLQWAQQSQGFRLIEALKAWADREGWSQDVSGLAPNVDVVKLLKERLIRAQTSRLGQVPQLAMYRDWSNTELDALIRRQGAEIRARKAG